jgi:hypothetical protein
MIRRSACRSPREIDIATLSPGTLLISARMPGRRSMAACAGILAFVFCSAQAGIAAGIIDVSNGATPLAAIPEGQRSSIPEERSATTKGFIWLSFDPLPPQQRSDTETAGATQFSSTLPRQSMCVRLCDGYYFPVGPLTRAGDLANHEAVCAGLCPDALTQLFVDPTGSDRIEDAVSSDGVRYTALPAAFRNRASVDKACTCHRRVGQSFSLFDDFTLRKGDSIMTAKGIVVFRGGPAPVHPPDDFVALADAAMPTNKREALTAIERASLPSVERSGTEPLPNPGPQIALAASPSDRSSAKPENKSIHFIEPMISANN